MNLNQHFSRKTSGLIGVFPNNLIEPKTQTRHQILFTSATGRVAHEFIIDLRPFKVPLPLSHTHECVRAPSLSHLLCLFPFPPLSVAAFSACV